MTQTGFMYINGKWTSSSTNETFASINPATGKFFAEFFKGNKKDVKKAIKAAESAYPKWSQMPAPKRAQYLFKVAEILKQRKEELARLVTLEMGKVISEARGDVQEAIDVFEYMAGEGRRLFGHTTKSELKDKFAMTIRMPVGVVGLISPWNFPIAIPAWKIAPALICGNTIVFKPSSDTPRCVHALFGILHEAKIPKGVVNLVFGSGRDVGTEIVTNEKIRGISFTGSRSTGEEITRKAGLKKVGLELGGKNAIIIMDDANLKLALDGVIWGAFGTTGQRCTATSRIIVHKKVISKFESMLKNRMKTLRLGSGLKSTTDVGPLINKSALEKVCKYVEIGRDEGAKLVAGGKKKGSSGFFHEPTLFSNVTPDMRIAQEEIFGPVLSSIECKNLDHAIEIANNIEYGLSSAIYTNDISRAFKGIELLETGLTYVNSSTIGSEVHLPFGGVKATGHTKEAGIHGIDEFSNIKTVYVDYSNKLQKAQIDLD